MKLRRPLLTALLVLGGLMGCATPSPPPPATATKVTLHIGTEPFGTGSGVVLLSDEDRGTYVLTCAHVVGIHIKNEEGVPVSMLIMGRPVVTFPDGYVAFGTVVATEWDLIVDVFGPEWVDAAIVRVPFNGVTYQGIGGLSPDGIQKGESITLVAFSPAEQPYSVAGVGLANRPERYSEAAEFLSEVLPGNSGAGVYETDTGLLGGVVWGRTTEDGKHLGYMTESVRMLGLFRTAGLHELIPKR